MYSGGPPIWATVTATFSVGTISIASHGQTNSSYGFVFLPGMWTHTSQPTHRSKSISHHCCVPFTMPRSIFFSSMQSTGQTSRHDSQPVQLSALITANSFGTFLRGPSLAMGEVEARSPESSQKPRPNSSRGDCEIYHNLRLISARSQAGHYFGFRRRSFMIS